MGLNVEQPGIVQKNNSMFQPKLPEKQTDLEDLRRRNNPDNKPVGPFTGRCEHCESADLWDDNWSYGCNSCGAMLGSN